jgi:hypothetical protein
MGIEVDQHLSPFLCGQDVDLRKVYRRTRGKLLRRGQQMAADALDRRLLIEVCGENDPTAQAPPAGREEKCDINRIGLKVEFGSRLADRQRDIEKWKTMASSLCPENLQQFTYAGQFVRRELVDLLANRRQYRTDRRLRTAGKLQRHDGWRLFGSLPLPQQADIAPFPENAAAKAEFEKAVAEVEKRMKDGNIRRIKGNSRHSRNGTSRSETARPANAH